MKERGPRAAENNSNKNSIDPTLAGPVGTSRRHQERWTRRQVQPYGERHPEADLDALELNLLMSITESTRRAAMIHRLAALGLSKALGQYTLLRVLLFYDELTHSDLAHEMRVTLSNVTRLVDQMQDSGWIQRKGDPDDKRITYVRLTQEGSELARKLVAEMVQFSKDVTECFSRAEMLMFIEFLSRIHAQAEALDIEDGRALEKQEPLP